MRCGALGQRKTRMLTPFEILIQAIGKATAPRFLAEVALGERLEPSQEERDAVAAASHAYWEYMDSLHNREENP